MNLTETQYQLLLQLYHELNECFVCIPRAYSDAFFNRLYKR